jgi:ligand-binding SRPBCC domain-containing protein
MNITIQTSVKASLSGVVKGFNQDLFLKLNPPFPPVRLLQFDGCLKGDHVRLELNFLLFKQDWHSEITESHATESEFYFIDEGRKLPFFLKSWRHKHIIRKENSGAVIIDDITYTTGTLLTDFLFYPALLGQFIYRKPVYKRVFKG